MSRLLNHLTGVSVADLMTRKLKYGVIGCGHLGRFHAQKAAEIVEIDLVGVFDIDVENSRAVAELTHCVPFQSIDELLRQVEAVSVVVPTEDHFVVAKQSIEAGKHVLLEKPITVTVAEGRELTKLASGKGVKLQVGHIERFNPAYEAFKRLPNTPQFVEAHRLSQFNPRGLDVAVILDLMIHDIDLVLSVIDSKVKEIHASGVAVISDKADIANARIEFENGTVVNLTASRISAAKMRKIRLFLRDHYLSIDLLRKSGEHYLLSHSSDHDLPEGYISAIDYEPTGRRIIYNALDFEDHDALAAEIRSFAAAVLEGADVVVSGEDGTAALAIAIAIQEIVERNVKRLTS